MMGRDATIHDLGELYEITVAFLDEMLWKYEPERIVKFFSNRIGIEKNVVRIVEANNKIVGIFVAFVDTNVFSGEKFGHDNFFYVDPDFRNSEVAICLYREYLDWARSKGCKESLWNVYGRTSKDRLLRVLEKMGQERIGYIVKETL
jgi:GNAT superfamily N-acetyltransferase